MADAEQAIKFVLANEGGFVDNAKDPGGATNYGLSLRFLREIPSERLKQYGIFTLLEFLSKADIEELRPEQAELIYQCEFWNKAPYKKIESQPIADYVFDMVVNHGENQAIKLLQRSLWARRHMKDCVVDDGILGSYTLDNVNMFAPSEDRFLVSILKDKPAYLQRPFAKLSFQLHN